MSPPTPSYQQPISNIARNKQDVADNQHYLEYTPDEIESFALGQTKASIRDKFGSPDQVRDDLNVWTYWTNNPRLAVIDKDAGKRVLVDFDFVGAGNLNDKVIEVYAY